MKTLLNLLLKTRRRPRRHPPKPTGGYTMIELLVGMVIAFLIITPMLAFVVNILNNDVREQAKTSTEQDLQAAIDYIAQDISQAVYIYDPEYAGDSTTTPAIPSYATFKDQLPKSNNAKQTWEPVLVFWKREYVDNALDPSGSICADPENDSCNDTFVLSLVAYYEITETDTKSIWCASSGSPCPKRIARFQIQDGVRDSVYNNYVCDQDGDDDGRSTECQEDPDLRGFQRDLGFGDYQSNPTAWQKKTGEDYTDSQAPIVLVNYIEGFNLNNPLVDTDGDGTLDTYSIQASGYKFAKIEIVGNALRRSQNDFSCTVDPAVPTYKNDPYCPKVTAQVGARSFYEQ